MAGEGQPGGGGVRHHEVRKRVDNFWIASVGAKNVGELTRGVRYQWLNILLPAWDPMKAVVLAPAMNTLMWQHPFTRRHLRAIAADFGVGGLEDFRDEDEIIPIINQRSAKLRIAAPISKKLACGDEGIGAMANLQVIADFVD